MGLLTANSDHGVVDPDVGAWAAPDLPASTSFDTRLMARVLAGCFAAGATLRCSPWCCRTPTTNELGSARDRRQCLSGRRGAGLAGRRSRRAGRSRSRLPGEHALITGVAYFSGESPSPLVFFYLWVFLYSSYFFSSERPSPRSSMSVWPTSPC